MPDLMALEATLIDAVHSVLHDVKANAPTLEASVGTALSNLGAPGEIASAISGIVGAELAHWRADQAAKVEAAQAAKAAQDEPASE